MSKPTVVNVRTSQYDVYIGRAGKGQDGYFGNPFSQGTREQVIEQFEAYARKRIATDSVFKERVRTLSGRLGCFCHPKACHGDILVKLWEELNINKEPAEFVPMPILGFQREYRWLSNFWICPNGVTLDGYRFRCSEAAYVAHKLDKDKYTKEQREEIYAKLTTMDGSESKKYGRNVMIRPDWNKIKVDAMRRVVLAKFSQNPDLRDKLKATGNAHLEETNKWRDTFWGVCNGIGENWLGKILMEVRDQL